MGTTISLTGRISGSVFRLGKPTLGIRVPVYIFDILLAYLFVRKICGLNAKQNQPVAVKKGTEMGGRN